MDEKEIEREFRLACVRACEKKGQPRPEVTVQADSLDDLVSLGQKMLDEMGKQGIVWMYEEAIVDAAHAIAEAEVEKMREGVVWQSRASVRLSGTRGISAVSDLLIAGAPDELGMPQNLRLYGHIVEQDGQVVNVTVTREETDGQN